MSDSWRTHVIQLAGDELDAMGREWLLTNGSGAYAMGTLPGINTRRYHGLLVAARRPPVDRIVALNQLFEQLVITSPTGVQKVEFSSCRFHDNDGREVYAPQGHTLLRRFDRGASVAWAYQWKHIQFVREVYLHWKRQAVTVRLLVAGLAPDESAVLRVHPMLTLRDFHHLSRKDQGEAMDVRAGDDQITVARGESAVTIACGGAKFVAGADWWFGIHYPIEAQRGQDDVEDYFVPGRFESACVAGKVNEVLLTASLGEHREQPHADCAGRAAHLKPIVRQLSHKLKDPALVKLMALASDDFVVDRVMRGRRLSTILAGYPWFADWGRDTFIALPGLLLATGRFDEACATLRAFADAVRNGLVPNRFDDYSDGDDAAHYNTVDASLWFIHAAMAYHEHTSDSEAWDGWLCNTIQQIIESHIKGTDFGIKVSGDGMIYAGNERTQLTWMDAKCNDVVFTPRQGKAVEINALWYHALKGMSDLLAKSDKRASDHYKRLSERIKRSFVKVFWDDELGYCRDHVWVSEDGVEHSDLTLRPNQILAASLPNSPLPQTKQRIMLRTIRERLLTPFGLRTLPEGDAHYHGRYAGPPFERDKAYHQGTVWPWLIGGYAEAVLRVGKFSDEARNEARQAIAPLLATMAGDGLGQLHEIHEGDEPHAPVGCIAQAWSVAEVLRVACLIEQGDGRSKSI